MNGLPPRSPRRSFAAAAGVMVATAVILSILTLIGIATGSDADEVAPLIIVAMACVLIALPFLGASRRR